MSTPTSAVAARRPFSIANLGPGFAALAALAAAVVVGAAGCATASGPAPGAVRALVSPVPPDADGAVDALVHSPRHGEWRDIIIDRAGRGPDVVRTWISYPERPDPAPVVLVIHEIMGLSDWVRGVADALAAEGFIAVAPDLLSGKGPDGGGSASFPGDQVRSAIRDLDAIEIRDRLDGITAFVTAMPAARDAVACTGFCWGGSTTFRYAAQQPALAAALVWYGTAPEDPAALEAIRAPVTGFYGGDDARVTSTVAATAAAMTAANRTYRPNTYEGAGHGFLRNQTARDGANRAAAEAAWRTAIDELRRRLGDGPGA